MKYVQLDDSLILYINGQAETIDSLHINYRKIQKAFKNNNTNEIAELLDVEELLKNGVFYLYKQSLHLAVYYINSNKNTQRAAVVHSTADMNRLTEPYRGNEPAILSFLEDWDHIGTFATTKEILNTYPEYFI